MEGTNDISQRVGVESIRFNLDEMAGRAEALGIIAVHASVIPRVPTAPADASNAATSALALAIRTMGEVATPCGRRSVHPLRGPPGSVRQLLLLRSGGDRHRRPSQHRRLLSRSRVSFSKRCCRCSKPPSSRSKPPPGPLQAGWLLAFGVSGNALDAVRARRMGLRRRRLRSHHRRPVTSASFTFTFIPEPTPSTVRGVTAGGAVVGELRPGGDRRNRTRLADRFDDAPSGPSAQDGQIVSDLVLANAGSLTSVSPKRRFQTGDRVRRHSAGSPVRRSGPGIDHDPRAGSLHEFGVGAGARSPQNRLSTPTHWARRARSLRPPSCTPQAIPTAAMAPFSTGLPELRTGTPPGNRSSPSRTARTPSRRSRSPISTPFLAR